MPKIENQTQVTTETASAHTETKSVQQGFINNVNFKGIDEETAVKKAGKLYAEPINRTFLINSVSLVVNADQKFYSIKADDAITDKPVDCTISEHHYNSFNFSELLPVGRYSGKAVKVKGVQVTTDHGYFDKASNNVVSYWKNGFFITEPRSDVSENELAIKRAVNNEASLLKRKLEMLLGCTFDPTNPIHLATLTAMS